MRVETKYHCSFCDDWYWTMEACEQHEKEIHPCYHCQNLVLWVKGKDGSLNCSCDAKNFHASYGYCRYHVEGEPNKEYYVEEENVD